MIRIPVSTDLVYRGIEYRLAEDIRERGASVRPSPRPILCIGCDVAIRRHTKIVLTPTASYHPQCAIRSGALIAVGGPS